MRNPAKAINLPNLLTLGRLLVTPLLVILLIREMYLYALLAFALAGITDGLDGLLARWLDQRTCIGAYLDPIADKALLMSMFISLAVIGMVPGWVAVIVISRDLFIVIGIAVFSIANIPVEIRPSRVSKFTTGAQLALVALILLGQSVPAARAAQASLCWVTAGLTIGSGLHYLYKGMNLFHAAQDRPEPDTVRLRHRQ